MVSRSRWVLVGALLGAASPAPAQGNPASTSTIETRLEQASGGDQASLIYIINRSSQQIIVTSIRLMECENIQGSCGVRRLKLRVPAGGQTMVQRVRPRDPDQPSGFRYTYTWELEQDEGPTAENVAKDPTALTVDTVMVTPKVVDLKVGESVDLRQILVITAQNAAGQSLPKIFFFTEVALGHDFISLDGVRLTGKAAGTAALTVWASTVNGPGAQKRGAAQLLVQVTP